MPPNLPYAQPLAPVTEEPKISSGSAKRPGRRAALAPNKATATDIPAEPPITAPESWTCKACNITVDASLRESHETEKRHKKARFTCNVCNVEISLQNQASHEAGKQHREKSQALQEPKKAKKVTSTSEPAPPKLRAAPPRTTRPPQDPERQELVKACQQLRPEWWTCKKCKVTMYASAQEAHKEGKCTGKSAAIIEIEPGAKGKDPTRVGSRIQKRLDAKQRTREQDKGVSLSKRRDRKDEKMRAEEDE